MKISYSKGFLRQAKLLSSSQKQALTAAIELFEQNPAYPTLRNHPLRGKFKTYRSIDIEPDLRALYIQKTNNETVFVAIGTHAQLYE
jgi:addiction module RelE/StbE family toxin